MKSAFHKEKFSFRFTKLEPDVASRLRESISALEPQSRIPTVVSLPLTEGANLDSLYSFLERESLDSTTYSVWTSVLSSSDHDGLSLPSHVLEVIRRTRAGVDFSFVACLGDDGDSESVESDPPL
jgi:hypothetical protein